MLNNPVFVAPNWVVPKQVKTLITTKTGGYSQNNFAEFNLALHVNDDPRLVNRNRSLLATHLPTNPYWLAQTHSNLVWDLDQIDNDNRLENAYDASITTSKNKVCVVMSADCLPILLTDRCANFVAAIHAGWRGLTNQVILNTLRKAPVPPQEIIAFIGPAICPKHFEVGTEIFAIFTQLNNHYTRHFSKKFNGKYECDLTGIAKLQLVSLGVLPDKIYISDQCTYCNNDIFYSYRKNNLSGRFASLIWLEE